MREYAPSSSRSANLPVGECSLALPGARLGLGLDDDHSPAAVGSGQRQRVRLQVRLALVAADAALQRDDNVGPLRAKKRDRCRTRSGRGRDKTRCDSGELCDIATPEATAKRVCRVKVYGIRR